MKTLAICISGSLRSLEYCKENLIEKLINPNKDDYEIKLFVYLPNDKNSKKIELLKELDMEVLIEDDKELKLPECHWGGRPSNYVVDSVSTAGLYGYMQQIYGMEMSYNMLCDYEKNKKFNFDVILRTRSDVRYYNPVVVSHHDLTKIIIPEFHSYDGINDRFAFGNRDIMGTYMRMYTNIYRITDKYLLERVEKIYFTKAEHFCLINLKVHRVPFTRDRNIRFNRVRENNNELNDC